MGPLERMCQIAGDGIDHEVSIYGPQLGTVAWSCPPGMPIIQPSKMTPTISGSVTLQLTSGTAKLSVAAALSPTKSRQSDLTLETP